MKRSLAIFLSFFLIAFVFCGCGGKSSDYESIGNTGMNEYDNALLSEGSAQSVKQAVSDRKLIKTVNMSVETKNFDGYINKIKSYITSLGGYTESYDESVNAKTRYCVITVRIPAESLDDFTDTAGADVSVTRRSENVDDATEIYVDAEARLKVLKAEEESLLEILKSAGSISDIMTVRERLSETRSEIESYEALIKSIDSKVSYSTVTLTVNEVDREPETEGYWGSIANNISDGFSNVIIAITDVFAILLSAVPYLIIPAIVIIVIIIVHRRNKKKKEDQED